MATTRIMPLHIGKAECKDCPFRNRCIGEKGSDKRIQVNIFEDVVKKNHEKGGTETHIKVLLPGPLS